jgi:uncharacterized protein YfaP (DUF2135 family)
MKIEVFFAHDAPGGNYTLVFAIDDGINTPDAVRLGTTIEVPIYVIEVGSGDIQINLHWKTLVDLDLHVVDPLSEELYYANQQVASGGELDLDSYPSCNFENDRGKGNENVFWKTGAAPSGQYVVKVNMFDDCGTYESAIPTEFRVTVVRNQSNVEVFTGRFVLPDAVETPLTVTTWTY